MPASAFARAARVGRVDLGDWGRELGGAGHAMVPLVNALRARLPAQAARHDCQRARAAARPRRGWCVGARQ